MARRRTIQHNRSRNSKQGYLLFLIILILSIICSYVLPWWIIALIGFITAFLMGKKLWQTFLSGFLAVFIAWAVMALLKSIPNDNELAGRVAQLFQLPGWIWLLLVTALIGGLVGGISALSGALIRKAFGNN